MQHRISVRPCILGNGLAKARCRCGVRIGWAMPRGVLIYLGSQHIYENLRETN